MNGEAIGLVERVELGSERIVVDIDLGRFLGEPGLVVRHDIAMRIKRRGVEMRLVIEGAGTRSATVAPALVKAVVRARRWFNNRRLLEPIGNIPPAEAEARYYALSRETAIAARLTQNGLRQSRRSSVAPRPSSPTWQQAAVS